MLDYHNNEIRELHEMACDQIGQTIYKRIQDSIRILRVHGFIDNAEAERAYNRLLSLE